MEFKPIKIKIISTSENLNQLLETVQNHGDISHTQPEKTDQLPSTLNSPFSPDVIEAGIEFLIVIIKSATASIELYLALKKLKAEGKNALLTGPDNQEVDPELLNTAKE